MGSIIIITALLMSLSVHISEAFAPDQIIYGEDGVPVAGFYGNDQLDHVSAWKRDDDLFNKFYGKRFLAAAGRVAGKGASHNNRLLYRNGPSRSGPAAANANAKTRMRW